MLSPLLLPSMRRGAVQHLDPAGANSSVPTVRRCQENEGKEQPCVVPVKPDAEGYKGNLLPSLSYHECKGQASTIPLPRTARQRNSSCSEKALDHKAVGSFVGAGLSETFRAGTFGKLLFSFRGGAVGGELLQEALPKTPLVPCRPLLLFNSTDPPPLLHCSKHRSCWQML